jgi:hypothetical protein
LIFPNHFDTINTTREGPTDIAHDATTTINRGVTNGIRAGKGYVSNLCGTAIASQIAGATSQNMSLEIPPDSAPTRKFMPVP